MIQVPFLKTEYSLVGTKAGLLYALELPNPSLAYFGKGVRRQMKRRLRQTMLCLSILEALRLEESEYCAQHYTVGAR